MGKKIFTDESLATFVDETKSYVNSATNKLKDDLLNGAGEAYDTLKELGDLISENTDAIDALEIVATGKADKDHVHDIYETKENAKIKYDELKAIQPDWNQNDETASDYIKNRTHYEEADVKTVVLEETIVYWDDLNWGYHIEKAFTLEADKLYEVTLNGEIYECTSRADGALGVILGNGSMPFRIMWKAYDPHVTEVTHLPENSGDYTFKISRIDKKGGLKLIDEKFIPDTIARVDSIPQSDWNQNDETSVDYIKNKPFWSKMVQNTIVLCDVQNVDCETANDFSVVFSDANVSPIVGATYNVSLKTYLDNIDWGTHSCVSWFPENEQNGYLAYIGNGSLFGYDGYGESVPFLIIVYYNESKGKYYWKIRLEVDESIVARLPMNVKIEEDSSIEQIKKLDEKYIPDAIARIDSIPQSDWNQNDETAVDYIKNRTHYESTSIVRGEELFSDNNISLLSDGEYNTLDTYITNDVEQYVEVVWDDVPYMCEIKQNDAKNVCFGDSNLTEYPFYYTEDGAFDTKLYARTGDHTIIVYNCTVSEVIKKIDKKILPDSVGENVEGQSYENVVVGYDPDPSVGLVYADNIVAGEGAEIFNDYSNNRAVGKFSHAEGENTQANGMSSHAEGGNTITAGGYTHAEGWSTKATMMAAHAEGQFSVSTAQASHAEGYRTLAWGIASHAEGYDATAGGHSSHAEGNNTKANGKYSHAEGVGTTASEQASHAEGSETTASGEGSHAEGILTTASGDGSHAEGLGSMASGSNSHAEGSTTYATGAASHAEGNSTSASGMYSHAEGHGANAVGAESHAEGSDTVANGNVSHAEGMNTEANGNISHAEGFYTIASGENQHVQGKFNIPDVDEDGNALNRYAHIVGNGGDIDEELGEYKRSNAHTLDWDGNAWYQGDVYVGGTSQDDGVKLIKSTDILEEKVGSDTLTWDGDTTGKEPMISSTLYLITDKVPTIDDLSNGFVETLSDGRTYDTILSQSDECITLYSVIIAMKDNALIPNSASVCPKKGVYFGNAGVHTASLKINGFAWSTDVKIKASYIPDDLELITVDDIDAICGGSIEFANMNEGAF